MNTETTSSPRSNWPVNILAAMMFLIPAVGVPSQLVLQDTLKASLLCVGTLSAASIFLIPAVRNGRMQLLWHHFLFLPASLAVYAIGSIFWSHGYLAIGEAVRWTIIFIIGWLVLNAPSGHLTLRLIWGTHCGTVAACGWVALQYWGSLDWFPQAAFPASTFANRNFFAEYAICALPFSIWLFLQATPGRWATPMAISISLCVAAILAAGTRSALLAMALLLVAASAVAIRFRPYLQAKSWRRPTKLAAMLAFVAAFSILATLPSSNPLALDSGFGGNLFQRTSIRTASLSESREYSEGSFSERVVMWKATARMAMANPIFGVGAGAWEVFIPLYQLSDTTMEFDYFAHNDVFQLLSEYGLFVGGLFWAFFIAFCLRWTGAMWVRSNNASQASLRGFALCSVLALLVVSGAGFPLHLASCCAVLGVSLGVLMRSDACAHTVSTSRPVTFQHSQRTFRVATTFVMLCLLGAIVTSIQAFRVEQKLISAILSSTELVNAKALNKVFTAEHKTKLLENVYNGIDINPHYRKLTPLIADRLAAVGDTANAVKIWQSVTNSRPHIAAIWANLALGYSKLGQHEEAWHALGQYRRLRPSNPENISLEIALRRNSGDMNAALKMVRKHFRDDAYDLGIVQVGFETAMLARDWGLAVEALERRNKKWPEWASDGYYQLGMIYSLPEVSEDKKAVDAFRAGLDATPAKSRADYLKRIPIKLQRLM